MLVSRLPEIISLLEYGKNVPYNTELIRWVFHRSVYTGTGLLKAINYLFARTGQL